MLRDPPYSAHVIEHLLFFFATYVPVISCSNSRSQLSVRINLLHIPSPVVTGDSVHLRCGYELGNETLYAVKWYKNMGEFFRYVPASDPPLKIIQQAGIDVDISQSDDSTVFLRNLSMESFGNYTCQVSTDKPFFRCVQSTQQMEVLVPPSDGPILMEEKSDYELGDNVSILCNSGRSKPAPVLKWYINDQLAQAEMSDQEKVVHADQLESTTLALRFRLKPDVIHNGKVVLKCVASVQNIHAETIREIIAGTRPTEIHKGLLYTAAILMLILHVTQMNQPV